MLYTVIGNSGCGKSTYLYEMVLNKAAENPDKNFLIIVPEQYTMATQRLLVAKSPNHCIMNIDVLSFNRLAHRVFTELGISSIGVLDDTGKSLVLRKLANEHIDELVALKKNMTRVGYITQVKSLISEMTQYNITPEVLQEMINYGPMSENFRLKAKDFLVLYQAFLDFIDGKYVTTESILSKLNEVLDDSELVAGSVIVFDGFTGFTPIQYQLVENFIRLSEDVYVSITADSTESLVVEHEDSDLFKMSSDFLVRLRKIAGDIGEAVLTDPIYISEKNGRFSNNSKLQYLEQNIFRRQKKEQPIDADGAIELVSLKNTRQELRYAAICISRMIRQGYSYSDFAIVCPSIDQYRYIIDSIFSEYKIPYFVDAKSDIIFHPFVEAIESVFEMYQGGFRSDAVFRFLKTGFSSLSRRQVDMLENYIISTGIRGKNKYFHPFAIRSNTFSTDQQLVEVNGLREAFIKPFIDFDNAINKTSTVRSIAEALYELCVAFDCESQIKNRQHIHEEAGNSVRAKEYSQIYKVVMNLLDKMVAILGDEVMSLDDFYDVFEAGLASATIGVIPPVCDSVILGDMERTRLDNISVLFLLGASDSAIPQKEENGGILSQLERELLLEKFEMAPSDRQKAFRQQFYLYLMLTKPKEKIIVTTPRVDNSGASVSPSYLFDMFRELFSDLVIEVIEDFSYQDLALSEETLNKHLLSLLHEVAENGLESLLPQQLHELEQIMAWADSCGQVDVASLIDNVFFVRKKELFSPEIMAMVNQTFNSNDIVSGSVSKFETYAQCSYLYFLTYILCLKEREKFELSSIDMGNFYHDALEQFGLLVHEAQKKWRELSAEETQSFIDIAITKTFEKMGKVATLEDPTQRYIVETMKVTLQHVVSVITEQIRRGTLEPKYFEQRFESFLQDDQSKANIAKLIGKVDRVDIDEDTGCLRIVDYKSSDHDLQIGEVYYGISLQLPIYMGAIIDKLQDKYPSLKLRPAAMMYYSTQNPFIENESSLVNLRESRIRKSKMDGLLSEEEVDLRANDETIFEGDTKSSSVVPLALTSKGIDRRTSKTVSEDDMQIIIDYAKHKATELALQIVSGDFDPRPKCVGKKTPCEFCNYKSVCHFDERVAGFVAEQLDKMQPEAAVAAMREDLQQEEER